MIVSIVGWTGAILVLLAYALVTLNKIKLVGWQYPLLNIAGGAGLVLTAYTSEAWPLVALNGIWIAVGIVGLIAFIRTGNPEPVA